MSVHHPNIVSCSVSLHLCISASLPVPNIPTALPSSTPCPRQTSSASETISLVASGTLTVYQVALDHLSRYDQRDSNVNAWAYLDRERVLTEAKRLDEVPVDKRGMLHGVVIGVKDVMSEWTFTANVGWRWSL